MTTAADINIEKEKALLYYIVTHIVDDQKAVKIEVDSIDDYNIIISLQVGKEDMGKIIGKNGQTARAIRILLRILGAKTTKHVSLKIIEP